MQEEIKYYTPDLSEFYFGFTFEFYNSNENFLFEAKLGWTKTKFGLSPTLRDLEVLDSYLNKGLIRVSELSQFDIKSKGWKFEGDAMIRRTRDIFYKDRYMLEYNYLSRKLTIKEKAFIRDGSGNYDWYTIFYRGEIKNISEFEKVVKQLGI